MLDRLMHMLLTQLTDIIDFIGVLIISVGVVYSIVRFFVGLFGKAKPITIDIVRLELGRSITLAVEFLLAADIIRTMIAPDYYSVGILASLVVIRTILIYFLNIELQSLSKQTR